MKRLFAAIKIYPSDTFLKMYYSLKTNLKNDRIKWVDTKNVHITLKFFGETAEDKIPGIISGLNDVASVHPSFGLKIENVGIFGSSYKPRVIWFGIREDQKLIELASDVLDAMDGIGFMRDRQNFVPHLTVGRIKFIDDKNRFRQIVDNYASKDIQEQKVSGFNLYESILKPQGPEYKIVKEFQLGA